MTTPPHLSSRRVGRHALLVEVEDARTGLALSAWARVQRLDALEVVPGASSVLFDEVADVDALLERLRGWAPEGAVEEGDLVELAVEYDGADLETVAELWGTDVDGVLERHTGLEFVSAFCGFAPGFAYLAGLPEEWSVPRLESPRARVPAGSVGLAGTWCGVYPGASPGGWQILGRTAAELWDPTREPPARLSPGTRVRFVPA